MHVCCFHFIEIGPADTWARRRAPALNWGCVARRSEVTSCLIRINNLFFEYGSDRLTSLSNSELLRVANLLIESQRKVKLTGHTDNIGGEQYNLELSERRAFAVKEALVGLGVPALLLDADGAGETAPVASNETEMGRKKNRRVELRFITE